MRQSQRDSDLSIATAVSSGSKVAGARQGSRFMGRGLMRWGQALCAALLLTVGLQAQGAVIDYSVTPLGGQTWQFDYTVTNDSEALTIDEFTIYFDRTLFGSLVIVGAPDVWDPLVAQPDLELPSDGFFDALALAFGIAPGLSLSGFSVAFTFLGSGTPGSQPFDIVDPETFAVLASGVTSLAAQAVPEPGTLSLLLLAAFVAGAQRMRGRRGGSSIR